MKWLDVYFKNDIASTIREIPSILIALLIALFMVGVIVLFRRHELKIAIRRLAGLLLIEYVILVVSSTVFLRSSQVPFGHNYTPFWSYVAIIEGEAGIVVDNVMNIVAFMPIGFLMGCAIKDIKWWKVALISCGCSITIETTQLIMSRGFSELDDVFNNTAGAIIGFGLYAAVAAIKGFINDKHGKHIPGIVL